MKLIVRVGVLVDVLHGGDRTMELACIKVSTAEQMDDTVWEKEVTDVACGSAIGFPTEKAGQVPELRISPLKVVQNGENIITIHAVRAQGLAKGEGR